MAQKFKVPAHLLQDPTLSSGAEAWMGEIDKAIGRLASGGLLDFIPSVSADMTKVVIGKGKAANNVGLAGSNTSIATPPPPSLYSFKPKNLTAFGNNLIAVYEWARVGSNALAYATSEDGGVTWTQRTGALTVTASGTIMATGPSGKGILASGSSTAAYLYSDDYGLTWAAQALPAGLGVVSVVWAGAINKWVMLGANTTVGYVSSTGLTGSWTAVTIQSGAWAVIAVSDSGRIVARSLTHTLVSTDGINWTKYALPVTYSEGPGLLWNQELGHFISDGRNKVLISSDGITWGQYTTPRNSSSTPSIRSIVWDGSKYVSTAAYPNYSATSPTLTLTSSTGTTWVEAALANPVLQPWDSVVYSQKFGTILVGLPAVDGTAALYKLSDSAVSLNNVKCNIVDIAESSASISSAPVSNSRIDRVAVNPVTGSPVYINGIESANPVPPAIPQFCLPVCSIRRYPGLNVCSEYHLSDERAPVAGPEITGSLPSNEVTPYGSDVPYRIFTSGTTLFKKPAGATWLQVTLVGAGGGHGGTFIGTVNATLGGAGGGGAFNSTKMMAEDLTVSVGVGGVPGISGTTGMTAGTAGGVTSVTGVTSGRVLSANGGGGGGAATTSPAVGAAGAAGAATNGGFAGLAGAAGVTAAKTTSFQAKGGAAGELGLFSYPTLTMHQATGSEKRGAGASSGWSATNVAPSSQSGGNGYVLIEWG